MADANCKLDDDDEMRRKDLGAIEAHAMQLSEQFDAVEIICTRDNGKKNGTVHVSSGVGNWYARYGAVRAWLKSEENRMGGE